MYESLGIKNGNISFELCLANEVFVNNICLELFFCVHACLKYYLISLLIAQVHCAKTCNGRESHV